MSNSRTGKRCIKSVSGRDPDGISHRCPCIIEGIVARCFDIINSTGKIPEGYTFPDSSAGRISPGHIMVTGNRINKVTLGNGVSNISLQG